MLWRTEKVEKGKKAVVVMSWVMFEQRSRKLTMQISLGRAFQVEDSRQKHTRCVQSNDWSRVREKGE